MCGFGRGKKFFGKIVRGPGKMGLVGRGRLYFRAFVFGGVIGGVRFGLVRGSSYTLGRTK